MWTFDLALATPQASSTNGIAAGSWPSFRRRPDTITTRGTRSSVHDGAICAGHVHIDQLQGVVHRRVNW